MELKYKHIFVLIALSLGTWEQPKVTYRQIVTSPIDSWVEVTDRTKAMNGETQEEASDFLATFTSFIASCSHFVIISA